MKYSDLKQIIDSEKNKKADFVIGIDPDVDRNGCALLNVEARKMIVNMLPFPKLIDFIAEQNHDIQSIGKRLIVVIEAGWMNKSNFHIRTRHGKQGIASLGVDQGRNEQVSRLIGEFMEHYAIPYLFKRPLLKCWLGKDRKITKEEIERITGQSLGRINQEGRDAALIAWEHAGLPIRIKPSQRTD